MHYRANNLEADLDKVMREARRLLSDWELTEKELKGLEKRVQKLEDAVFGSTDSDDEIANRRPPQEAQGVRAGGVAGVGAGDGGGAPHRPRGAAG